MTKKLKKLLPRIDEQIAYWKEIVRQYPLGGYQKLLDSLYQQRADEASKIGKRVKK